MIIEPVVSASPSGTSLGPGLRGGPGASVVRGSWPGRPPVHPVYRGFGPVVGL